MMMVKGKTMTRRFIVTHIDEDCETILAHYVEGEEVIDVVVGDMLDSSDLFAKHDRETRENACRAFAAAMGLSGPNPREQVTLRGRTYRVEELPDDPVALDEFYNARFLSPKLLKLVYRVPGKLRIEIWPNESQHRGRPHCRVSNRSKAASFTIPDGDLLVGDLHPDDREAMKIVRKHGDQLLCLWHRMRPDDQKL